MPNQPNSDQPQEYKPALFWSSLAALIWIILLLYAGGFTTTIRAGMAFLDWPLSNGSINPDGWLENEDMMAEHSHRLLGMVMGLLSISLCVGAFVFRTSKLVKRMGVFLVIMVIVQGLLGGLRVRLDKLNLDIDHNLYAQTFAVAHATLAQVFLCLLVSFVVSNSRSWVQNNAGFDRAPSKNLSTFGIIACLTLVAQLIIGAIMRHNYAGLAITTFPYSDLNGAIIPPAFNFEVAIHFAHRVGAVIVSIAIIAFCIKIWKSELYRKAVGKSAVFLTAALIIQGYLGAQVIWTVRNPHVTTFHMLNGAFTLAICWMITYRSYKFRIQPNTIPATELAPENDSIEDFSQSSASKA
ncbi:COX15/CtaA family protein [Puniceicoccaceae bacterium K14]|nr:COX15/CtaA family protein [Puniceicoccaceae bacterium K14]